MRTNNILLVILIVGLMALAAGAAIIAGARLDEVNELKAQLKAQNIALTKKAHENKADAFRAGIIACTNEDVEFLNDMADEVGGPVGKLFRDWAQTWAYDDDTMNLMTEEYMNDGQSY